MTIYTHKLQFNSSSSTATPAGWVDCGAGNSIGVKAEDIEGSGISFEITVPAASAATDSSRTDQDHWGIPETVWDRNWVSTNDGFEGVFSGFIPEQPVTVTFFGASANDATRKRILTINGITREHDNPDTQNPVTPYEPVTFIVNSDENGELQCHFGRVGTNASYAGLIISHDSNWASGPKITSFNDDDFAGEYGQQSLMTVSGFDGTVNTATVAGVACTGVSDTGLTLPALVDETTVPMPIEVELEVESDEAETATANITVFPPGGFNSVILGDDLNQTETGTVFQFVPEAKEGNALFTPFVVDSKGNIIDAPAGVYECWDLSVDDVDPNIAVARSFIVRLGESAEWTIEAVGVVRIGGTAEISLSGPAAITSGTLDDVSLASASHASISIPSLVDAEEVPRPGVRTLTLADGGSSSSIDVSVLPPSGWAYYTLTADFIEAINGVAASFLPGSAAVGDFIFYPSAKNNISDRGIGTSNVGTQEFFHLGNETNIATAFGVVTSAGAAAFGGSASGTNNMHAVKMTARKMGN